MRTPPPAGGADSATMLDSTPTARAFHLHRDRLVDGVADAELTVVVIAPTPDCSVCSSRERKIAAGRERHDPGPAAQTNNRNRHVARPNDRGIAQIAAVVAAPAPRCRRP